MERQEKRRMKNKHDTEKPQGAPLKMVLTKFPEPLLEEVDALCDFNGLDRSEFIILAANQLLDYLDRKIGVRAPQPTDDYDDIEDEPLEAAEEEDE